MAALLYLADAELAVGDRAAARTALIRARKLAEDEPILGGMPRRVGPRRDRATGVK